MFKKLGVAVAAITLACAGSASAATFIVAPKTLYIGFSCVLACPDGSDVDFTPATWSVDPAKDYLAGWIYVAMRSLTFDVMEITDAAPLTKVILMHGGAYPPETRNELLGYTDENGFFRIEGLGVSPGRLTIGSQPYDLYVDASGISATPVPEASTWALLIAGFGGIGWALRRRRLQAA